MTILARIVHNTACWLTPCWLADNHFLLLHWLLQHEPVFESVKQLVAGADWTESLRVTQSPMSSWSHQINSCKSSVSQFFGLSCKWDSPWSCSAGPGWSGSRHPQCSFVTHWQLKYLGAQGIPHVSWHWEFPLFLVLDLLEVEISWTMIKYPDFSP